MYDRKPNACRIFIKVFKEFYTAEEQSITNTSHQNSGMMIGHEGISSLPRVDYFQTH